MKKDTGNQVAQRLKKVRLHLQLSQKELATELNMSNATLSEIENGKYNPSHDLYSNISSKYNVNLYYLIHGEEPMFKDANSPLSGSLDRFGVKTNEMSHFLSCLEKSRILQYFIFYQFNTKMMQDGKMIQSEIEQFEAKEENKKEL